MHTPDPTDMTRTILDNRVPFCSEIGPDGEWPLTRVRATRAMTFEIPICDPWAIENTITRLLPNGKRIHQSLVRRYVLAEGEECEIPTAAMRQVRSVHCKHAACLRKPFDCADPGHVDAHFVVGGLAPMIGVVLGLAIFLPLLKPASFSAVVGEIGFMS